MKRKPSRSKTDPPNSVGDAESRNPPPYRVFVSHATYDKFLAKVICEKIEALPRGLSTFRDDRDIAGGDIIPMAIKEAIRGCQELVVILTPKSIDRQWILVEIGMAELADLRIVPLMYHTTPDEIPAILRDRRGFQLDEIEQYLTELGTRASEPRS